MTTTMNISLPESLKDYVRERVSDGQFSNPSDYIRALIREDRKRQEREKLERLLIEGLESGPMETLSDDDWGNVRTRLEQARRDRQAS